MIVIIKADPVNWSCRILTASLRRGKTPPNVLFDTKQYDSKASVMVELHGMQYTSSLPSLPSPEVVAPDRFLSMDQIELFDI